MMSSRWLRHALIAAVGAVLLFAAWVAWQAWQVDRDLSAAVDEASALRAAVESGDQAAAAEALEALQESSAAAADRTSGPIWSALTRVPGYGDDARGVRTASQVIDDLARDGIEPLIDVYSDLDQLLPSDGAVPVDRLAALSRPVSDAAESLAVAEADLAEEDASGYDDRLRAKYDDLRDQVARAADAMASAEIAVRLLPALLGVDGDRDVLLVFQNNAEIRATGGLPGALSLVHADRGVLSITRQTSAGALGRSAEPVLPVSEAERALYQDVAASYFLSANMTPDVPRAAAMMREHWEQAYDGDIDGVVLIDTVALSYVLDATGPITVGEVTLDGANLVDELLHRTYLRLEDPRQQDAFFADVAHRAFEKFVTGADDPIGLIRALTRATDEGRVNLHLFDSDEQAVLEGTRIAGEIATDPDLVEPQVAITVNDATASKMSYYLRYEVDVTATSCADGVQGVVAKMRLRSVAPPDAAQLPDYVTGGGAYGTAPGNQLVIVRVFGPVGGSLSEIEVNARPVEPTEVEQDDRPVAMFYVDLKPGQTVDLAWSMESGEGQTGDVDVSVTPSIEPGSVGGMVRAAC